MHYPETIHQPLSPESSADLVKPERYQDKREQDNKNPLDEIGQIGCGKSTCPTVEKNHHADNDNYHRTVYVAEKNLVD